MPLTDIDMDDITDWDDLRAACEPLTQVYDDARAVALARDGWDDDGDEASGWS